MKKFIILSALVALTGTSSFAFAEETKYSKPYMTTFTGYQLSPSNAQKHQEQSFGFSQDDHGFAGVAYGLPLKNGYTVQAEYSQVKASGNGATTETTQHDYLLIGMKDVAQLNESSKVYGLAGGGYSKLIGEGASSVEQPIAVVGGGINYKVNDTVTAVSEIRGKYNTQTNYWQPQVVTGVKINLGGF